MFGTLFMAFHGSQGPHLGLPQMIQSRAQFGYRGVILVLLATLFVFAGFNIVNLVLMMQGLHTLFGFNPIVVAVAVTLPAAVLAILGHDWMHRSFKWALFLSLPLYGLVTLAVLMGWVPDAPMPVLAAGEVAPAPLGFQLDRFHRPVRCGGELQHRLCALCVRLFALPAEEHLQRQIDRGGVSRRLVVRCLDDFRGWLAGRSPAFHRRAGRPWPGG